jgi:hypothetical protein
MPAHREPDGPVVQAALQDAHLEASAVDEIILGNTTAGGNPRASSALPRA